MIKKVRENKQIPLPILLDTKGPEFRIKTFKNGKIKLNVGEVTHSAFYAPLYVAIEKGFFEEEGIEIDECFTMEELVNKL